MTPADMPKSLQHLAAQTRQEPYRTGALVSLLQLHWFIRLRWVIVALALAGLGVERLVFPGIERPRALWVVLFGVGVINIVWMAVSHFLVRRFHAVDQDEHRTVTAALIFANAQVGVDLLMLTLVLRYTGGVESPMLLFYLFHMAIGSLLLRWWQAVLQGVWAVSLFGCMAVGEWAGVLQHHSFLPGLRLGAHENAIYVAGTTAVLSAGVLGTLYFTLKIAGRLDDRERRLRRANEALRTSQRAITDLQARRSRFMQTAAHQLKSPLAGIQTLTGLIRDGVVPPDAIQSTCTKIIDRCQAGITQVSELLTLARVQESDPDRHHDTLVDAGEVVEEILQRHESQAHAKGLDLRKLILCDLDLRAHVDRRDLVDCVTNLLENAIKYTPGEGGEGKVTVSVRRETLHPHAAGERPVDYIAVTVADTGIGIAPDSLTGKEGPAGAGSVFDAFRRGNEALSARIPGTGLGLSIVREVVEQAGGRLRVHSKPGRGSKFTVLFPARQEGEREQPIRDTRISEIVVDMAENEKGNATIPQRTGAET